MLLNKWSCWSQKESIWLRQRDRETPPYGCNGAGRIAANTEGIKMFIKYAKQHLDKPEFFWRRVLMWINYNWGFFFLNQALQNWCIRRKVSQESETKTSAGKSSKAFLKVHHGLLRETKQAFKHEVRGKHRKQGKKLEYLDNRASASL